MTFETKINDRIKAARKEGEAYGRLENLLSLVKRRLISEEIAAEEAGMSVEAFVQKMNPASVCEDVSKYGEK